MALKYFCGTNVPSHYKTVFFFGDRITLSFSNMVGPVSWSSDAYPHHQRANHFVKVLQEELYCCTLEKTISADPHHHGSPFLNHLVDLHFDILAVSETAVYMLPRRTRGARVARSGHDTYTAARTHASYIHTYRPGHGASTKSRLFGVSLVGEAKLGASLVHYEHRTVHFLRQVQFQRRRRSDWAKKEDRKTTKNALIFPWLTIAQLTAFIGSLFSYFGYRARSTTPAGQTS
jgi:hypothetical protein